MSNLGLDYGTNEVLVHFHSMYHYSADYAAAAGHSQVGIRPVAGYLQVADEVAMPAVPYPRLSLQRQRA